MLPRGKGYHRIGDDEQEDKSAEQLNPIISDSSISVSPPSTLRVLYKEHTLEIKDLSGQTTVAELKERIATVSEVPSIRQRLVAAGKSLQPDELSLAHFKLVDYASIHLYPRPVQVPVATGAASASSSSSSDPSGAVQVTPSVALAFSARPPEHRLRQYAGLERESFAMNAAHGDSYILQTGRELKLWSMLLIFLSAISLFNNLSYFSATGNFGNGSLDSLVFLLDTVSSPSFVRVD
jgi:hypothetical protein